MSHWLLAVAASCTEPASELIKWWNDPSFGYVDARLELPTSVAGNWLLLIGDSSLRMTYHLLRGNMALGWQKWPLDLDNHGWRNMSADNGCELAHGAWVTKSLSQVSSGGRANTTAGPTAIAPRTHWGTPIAGHSRYEGAMKCLEHVFVRGMLITFVWVDFFDVDQLAPLKEFARNVAYGAPEIVLAMGAYHSAGMRGEHGLSRGLPEFKVRYDAVLRQLQTLFPNALRRVAAGLPKCWTDWTAETSVNEAILNASTAYKWKYFDRAVVTARPCDVCPCEVSTDCSLVTHHPRGPTLNVLTKLLLMHLGYTGIQ